MKRLARLIDGGLRMLDQERLVRASGYFDADWYVRTYPEVGGPHGALAHFLQKGAAAGHDPGPAFSTSAYLAANPDVRAAGCNALVHYLRFGRDEGRGAGGADGDAGEPLGPEAMERIREAFDADFYAATNPDLPEDTDWLQHFLGTGWWERRDPCAWFSVEYYLAAHPDLAEAGKNPFVHYLLWGCREARAIRASQRRVIDRGAVSAGRRPRLAALAMVRNERDIIRAFSAHVLGLFDDIVFIDHMSDDGTFAFLKSLEAGNRRVRVMQLSEPAYLQSVTMTHAVREFDVLRDADWVFLLDADEFLPFAGRTEFEAALRRLAECPVIEMRWQNLVPESYWQDEVEVTGGTRFLIPPELSPFRKIAFQPSRISLGRTIVDQGNHALIETLNGLKTPAYPADFPLLHIPVRSADQLVLKLNQGVEAYRRMGKGRDAAHGTHWDQMARATVDAPLTPDLLNAVVVRYSEDKPMLEPVTAERLLSAGHRVATFDLASADTGQGPLPPKGLGELLMRIHGRAAPDRDTVDNPAVTRLTLADGVLQRAEGDGGADYAALPDAPLSEDGDTTPAALFLRVFSPGYRDIDDLVPSPKAEHIPFLFALADILRPRRMVEIGTLRGASFLALCQAARQGGFPTEAIAISGWSVGNDVAEDYRGAFETFAFLARKYSDFAGFLRMRHETAAMRFADGSIDLLHLDGFCEEMPLRQAIALWRPKLSARGVLLLHDTGVHAGGFGVWRVWEDLAADHPAFQFPHAQGLGLACLGPDAPADLVEFCRAAQQDRHLRTLIRQHFERLGRQSAELFSRRYDMAQTDARARAEGALAEEASWLRQEADTLRAENVELRNLLKGSISHAIGG